MLTKQTATAATLAIVALFAGNNAAKADYYDHIHGLAKQLEGQTRDLQREFARTYRHATQFGHLMSDTREMAELAEHIHEVTDERGSPFHLQEDLRKLDDLFHHIEELVRDIDRAARYGHGHTHGCTWDVRRQLRAVSNTLHHMKDDVDKLVRDIERGPGGPAPGPAPGPIVVPGPPPGPVGPPPRGVFRLGPFRFILH